MTSHEPPSCLHAEGHPDDGHVYMATPLCDERRRDFERVFGEPIVRVTAPLPCLINLLGEPRLAYWIHIGSLKPEVLDGLIAHLGGKFGMSREECLAELKNGVPIVAEDLVVAEFVDRETAQREAMHERQN